MSDSFQYGDLILLGLIAAFIVLRLRAMLGKTDGDSPASWKPAAREITAEKPPVFGTGPAKKPVEEEEAVPAQLQGNAPVAAGLKAIRASDPNFSATEFLTGAKLAFEWVVEAYAKGDKGKLQSLLSDERYKHFAADIDTRADSGQVQQTTLVSILSTDVTEVGIAGGSAHITVQFTSEQVHVTRDKDGSIVSGDASAIERVVDVWTFERSLGSRDPNWKIVST